MQICILFYSPPNNSSDPGSHPGNLLKFISTKKVSSFEETFHVIPPGFEPGTHSLEGCCSIQLSYETIVFWRCKNIKISLMRKYKANYFSKSFL